MRKLVAIARFVKIEHTLFSLPLLFAGVFIGSRGAPSARTLALAFAAGAGARVWALALNRILDRRIDARNPRTATRELPSGVLSVREGWLVAGLGAALFLASTAALPPPCLALSPVPLSVFALYPLLKRWTSLCHAGVGLALALAPLGGYLAAGGRPIVAPAPIALAAFTLLWVTGFDVIYATLDEAFDRANGIRSLPAALGSGRALQAAGLLHAVAFGALCVAAAEAGLRLAVAAPGLACTATLLAYEHLRARDDVPLAFFKVNAMVGVAVLATFALGAEGIST